MDEHGRQRPVTELIAQVEADLSKALPDSAAELVHDLAGRITRGGTAFAEMVADRIQISRTAALHNDRAHDLEKQLADLQDKADMYESDRDAAVQTLDRLNQALADNDNRAVARLIADWNLSREI